MSDIETEILQARVLIVDDQAPNVQLLTRLLREAGYTRISSTMNPAEVLGLHAEQDFDLILLDLQMPLMDGFAVMTALQDQARDAYLPVLVLTAQPGHKLRALQAGAKDFISKPFDLLEVKTRIRNMLEVRLLYRRLDAHNAVLEAAVRDRTAALRESEARYRALTELASDWYWEQDEHGEFTHVSGPVHEMLGIRADALQGEALRMLEEGWDQEARGKLQARIAARQPFVDHSFHRNGADGARREFRVSGQPMFDAGCRFLGYRGIGVEIGRGR